MSNSTNVHLKKNIFGGVVGNILEWYDFAVFGGTSPLICTWLVSRTGDITAPAYYLIAMSVVSFVATITLRRNLDGDLEN